MNKRKKVSEGYFPEPAFDCLSPEKIVFRIVTEQKEFYTKQEVLSIVKALCGVTAKPEPHFKGDCSYIV